MSVREGNLEPPTRHPIDWKNPDYCHEGALLTELERVFDICHGCRRCLSLCNAFPTLFDLMDDSATGEVDGVAKDKYWAVVDQCYLCDVCFMTKCPYVPPHPWNLDFPHLMLRAKAIKFKKGQVPFRDKLLASTDALGKLLAIPVVAQTVNAASKNQALRSGLDKVLKIHHDRQLPDYAPQRFRASARTQAQFPVRDGQRAPGKVAIFSTCYINYHEPGIGHDLLKILAHNEVPTILVEREACCGMPKLELGDLEAVNRLKEANIPVLAKLAREGYAILTALPSCALMFKQELPLMYPDDADVRAVAGAMFDPFEYLALRHKDGLLKTDFKQSLGTVSYHIPCHLRVQNLGQKTRELLQMIPNTTVHTVERCAGHDGAWGVKSEYFDLSMKIGKPVFKQMASVNPDYISSDCAIAGRHICQGMGETSARKQHPISLIRIAYGL